MSSLLVRCLCWCFSVCVFYCCWLFFCIFLNNLLYKLWWKNLTQSLSAIIIHTTEKASHAFIQTECVHENGMLVSIKSLTSDFISLFLFKTSWVWERNAVANDRWPSEGIHCNNLSHSPPLIKAEHTDVFSMRSTGCARLSLKQKTNFLCICPWVCPNKQAYH